MAKIIVVVPSIRDEQMKKFRDVWRALFQKHKVTLVTIWDGEIPQMEVMDYATEESLFWTDVLADAMWSPHRSLFCRFTDACRNIGFVYAASLKPDYILTLDDDVAPENSEDALPVIEIDPIADHIAVLQKRVPISWMNTAHMDCDYLRGVPYGIRNEAPVMLSHGVWDGVPDFDGETQLKMEQSIHGVPYTLPYYRGPIPRGVLFPLCGMNVMVRAEALPYLYFAPMGPDAGVLGTELINKTGRQINKGELVTSDMVNPKSVPLLNRFADIWMGVFLKREFDRQNWACYTGGSTVFHTRASDAKKNFEQEKLGREWNEYISADALTENVIKMPPECNSYLHKYGRSREQYANLIREAMKGGA